MTHDRFAQLPHGIRVCYRVTGDDGGIPVLLISGMSQDLTIWPQEFVDGLVAYGFRVIQHDNRDIGRSTPMSTRPPSLLHQLRGRARPDAYTLEDMAQDSVGLLDHLGVERAHLIGQSMGGMIAQTIAAHHPERVLTLTSMYSTTGAPGVGGVAWSTKLKIAKRPPRGKSEFIARHLEFTAHLAGRRYPIDPVVETAVATTAWERRGVAGAAGIARQIQAIQASGDRSKAVSAITAPTLVIHGDRDLIVHPSGGRATADTIAGAEFVSVEGMGHHFAPALVEPLLERISAHLRAARPSPHV
ncbi:alpha/beta fold hydrolase [Flexivirga oryzae]|uniref:Pimeloyl-ACP methyl ester carboxylesterase n=1 Tax=Flexivirga oryzae TaxID=1794944 RepID=A0A839NA10_9MICO|nr:alpha/beta fold hydrolase [Flexivirga oryzae]MBB2892486.1 pimeloyl-ACP methyl ester carboxylesterase [Flexivirga oryzae]